MLKNLNSYLLSKYQSDIKMDNKSIKVFVDEIVLNEDYEYAYIITKPFKIPFNASFEIKGNIYKILKFNKFYDEKGSYHHNELKLVRLVTIPNPPLIIFNQNYSFNECKLNKELTKLYEINDYILKTVNPIKYIDNLNLQTENKDMQVTHTILIDYKDNIVINQLCFTNNKYFKILFIENINESNTFLKLFLREMREEKEDVI
jgi:hypothetical protein